ncbi:universal stress family protein [Paraburkholderia fungorum]|jgi:nucleotide-binding universal stress UspA family protein|uniref:Universal stress family protein n=1 Tax=Paraburkholderia fungorum TaxID=134537 RepID=A0AAP5UYP3_9BURK|nr:universal stress protein [Paraburkholderia fungorum]AJZ56925.1 universal stress family protein [Paraburkholderia fungorum]MDT8843296.1 universal stress protein [Paraburkholderia fungorum]
MSAFGRILLCYDATREGRRALRHGASLAEQLKAETHLLAVLNSLAWTQGADIASAVPVDALEQSAREILRDGIEVLAARGVIAAPHFAIGDPLDHIPFFARELKPDLIVVGHRRSGLVRRWWSGKNDGLLLDRVSCAVLVAMDLDDANALEQVATLSVRA